MVRQVNPPSPREPTQGEADDASNPDTGQGDADVPGDFYYEEFDGFSDAPGTGDDNDDNGEPVPEDDGEPVPEDDGEPVPENDATDQDAQPVSNIIQRLARETPGDFNLESNDDSITSIQGEDDHRRDREAYERANDRLEPVDDFPTDPDVVHYYISEIFEALTNFDGAVDSTTPSGKDSTAVKRIKSMKKSEIVTLAYMLWYAIRDAQRGLSRGVWGNSDLLHPQRFGSWMDRYVEVIGNVMFVKGSVLRLINERESFAYELAAQPAATSARQKANRTGNMRKAAIFAQVKAEKQQSGSSSAAQTTSAAAAANSQNQSIPTTLGSLPAQVGRDGQDNARSGPSTGEKRKQPSVDPPPVLRLRLPPQAQEDPRLSTRGTTDTRSPKRQKRDSTSDGTHFDAFDVQQNEEEYSTGDFTDVGALDVEQDDMDYYAMYDADVNSTEVELDEEDYTYDEEEYDYDEEEYSHNESEYAYDGEEYAFDEEE